MAIAREDQTLPLPSASLPISVVIPALNEAATLRPTVEQLQATLPDRSEIVVVDDGSTDGGADFLTDQSDVRLLRTNRLGASAARNWGAAHTTGEILVFADAHINLSAGWWQPLLAALEHPNVGAVGPAISVMGKPQSRGYGYRFKDANLDVEWLGKQQHTPYPVPLLCGCFLVMRRLTFDLVGGFDSQMIRWGTEDSELNLRLWLLGYDLLLVPQVEVAHLFRKKHPYAIDWQSVIYNMLRLTFTHFSPDRITRVIDSLKQYRDFAAALALSMESDLWTRRATLSAQRVRTDDWFCDRFGIIC